MCLDRTNLNSAAISRLIFALGCISSFLISLGFMITITAKSSPSNNFVDKIYFLNNAFVSLSCLICFSLVLSAVGIAGVFFSSREMLVIYEILISIFLLTHLAIFVCLCINWPKVNEEFRQILNETINIINYSFNHTQCDQMRHLSESYSCCGLSGPQDFIDLNKRHKCCAGQSLVRKTVRQGCGCADVALKAIKDYLDYFIIVPGVIVLFVEVVWIVGAPFVIKKLIHARRVYFRLYEEMD